MPGFQYPIAFTQLRREKRADANNDAVIKNLTELREGAPVVHIDHGVGRYLGLVTMEFDGQAAEFLTLEYAEGAKLYVPVANLHLIARYTGSDDALAPLHRLGHLLEKVPSARLFDEILKLYMGGSAIQTFELLRHYRLFGWLFPATERCLSHQQQHYPKTLLVRVLAGTDSRLTEGKTINPAFLFAALLWERMRHLHADGLDEQDALQAAADAVTQEQIRHTALPRRYGLPMREIWELQERLVHITGKRPLRLLGHPRFRAGDDFLLLRAEADDQAAELADWWTRFLALDDAGRARAIQPAAKVAKGKPRRRRKSRALHKDDPAAKPAPET